MSAFDPDRIEELRGIYLQMVANKSIATGIDKAMILGTRRTQVLARMRSEIWLELWGLGYSTPEIGHVVGRDHSSIVRSNQIMRNPGADAGYCKRAREAEARRAAIMAARMDRSAAITRAKMEAAATAQAAMANAVDAARKAREAQAAVERSMRDLVLSSVQAEAQATVAKADREMLVTELMFSARSLKGKERYDAIVRAMMSLEDDLAMRLWADYCRSAYPHTFAQNIALLPRAWAMRERAAA